jgi:hypothetical protein
MMAEPECIPIKALDVVHEGRLLHAGNAMMFVRPNPCLLARRVDLIYFDVSEEHLAVKEGEPFLLRRIVPTAPEPSVPICTVKAKSRLGRFWGQIGLATRDLIGLEDSRR